jgi:hypothetical protein
MRLGRMLRKLMGYVGEACEKGKGLSVMDAKLKGKDFGKTPISLSPEDKVIIVADYQEAKKARAAREAAKVKRELIGR